MSSERVLDYIKRNELMGRDDRILVAFSGGNDSLGLLYMLDELKEILGITIGSCHMNHMLRGEDALADEMFCKEVAKGLDIPFYSARRDAFAYSKEKGVSVEVAGRELRYAFFKEIMIKERYDKCATAHHLNDQCETLLLNLIRGTGLKGLTGISAKRDEFVRPILFLSKEEIVLYLEEKNLRGREDGSNEENIYQRNKLRNELIPYIETNFNQDFQRTLGRMSDTLREDMDYIEEKVKEAMEIYLVYEDEAIPLPGNRQGRISRVTIRKEAILMPKAVRVRLVREAIRLVKMNLKDIEEVHIRDILRLQEGETGKKIDIKDSVTAFQSYGDIIIRLKRDEEEKRIMEENQFMEELRIPGEYHIEGKRVTLRHVGRGDIVKDKNLRFLNGEILEEKITVRHRRDGDRIRPFGMNGYRKIKNVLIDKKIRREDRDKLLIFLNMNDVIYIGTMIISEDYKVKGNTEKVLEIGIYEGESI